MSNKSVWPPSNYDLFPETRVGALAIDAVAVLAVIVGFLLPRFMYRYSPGLSCSYFKRWGFWVCGRDMVLIDGSSLVIMQDRCCCPCAASGNLDLRKDDITTIRITRRPVLFAGLAWSFLTSCLIGIWLHFIPCIWWTCDWGQYDGEGVRGGIWFVTWGIMFIVLCFLTRTIAIEIVYKDKCGRPQCCLLAVCGGAVFDPKNAEVERIRKEISEFAFGSYESMKE